MIPIYPHMSKRIQTENKQLAKAGQDLQVVMDATGGHRVINKAELEFYNFDFQPFIPYAS